MVESIVHPPGQRSDRDRRKIHRPCHESYKSLSEALIHGGVANDVKVEMVYIEAEELEKGISKPSARSTACSCPAVSVSGVRKEKSARFSTHAPKEFRSSGSASECSSRRSNSLGMFLRPSGREFGRISAERKGERHRSDGVSKRDHRYGRDDAPGGLRMSRYSQT